MVYSSNYSDMLHRFEQLAIPYIIGIEYVCSTESPKDTFLRKYLAALWLSGA